MAGPTLPAAVEEMLQKPNPAVMGTVRPDGAPVTVATWYLYRDGKIIVNMDAERRRLEHIRNDPRVSITVLDGDDWGTHVSVQGKLDLDEDPGLENIDEIARHYTGHGYPVRDRPRCIGTLEIGTWHGWGRFA
jgi:PPOX class probable F420-dependent enzyme